MGTFFVSGTKKKTNNDITKIHPEKNKNIRFYGGLSQIVNGVLSLDFNMVSELGSSIYRLLNHSLHVNSESLFLFPEDNTLTTWKSQTGDIHSSNDAAPNTSPSSSHTITNESPNFRVDPNQNTSHNHNAEQSPENASTTDNHLTVPAPRRSSRTLTTPSHLKEFKSFFLLLLLSSSSSFYGGLSQIVNGVLSLDFNRGFVVRACPHSRWKLGWRRC
ncbi:hypothetical protein H5410_048231 [Solanum commersonii]|uniref:Uncharacterized protein n=1 Tax=Solanum commersonii TaxID=4109 RepID=A0A9J5XJ60_SOLCO|nr:hypothetical protein H5410_048231 [Solanum commersonii]